MGLLHLIQYYEFKKVKKVLAGAVLGVVVIFLSFLFWGYPKIDKILNNGLGKIGKTKISTQQNIKDVKAKLFGDSN
jgi:ATP-dependent RNA circularization protein (DNA/RNA ligase family)